MLWKTTTTEYYSWAETVHSLQVIFAKPNIKRANKSKQSSRVGRVDKQTSVCSQGIGSVAGIVKV